MRTVEEIQDYVFAAFENMLRRPAMYQPCSLQEFEARLSSYLWVLCVSEELEQALANELKSIQEERGWAVPLDIVISIQAEAGPNGEPAQLIDQVIHFYEDLAGRLGFESNQE